MAIGYILQVIENMSIIVTLEHKLAPRWSMVCYSLTGGCHRPQILDCQENSLGFVR